MTFNDLRIEDQQTVVFFPNHFRGTLVHVLKKAGINHAKVTSVAEGMRAAGLTKPPHIPMRLGYDRKTNAGAAIISNFNAEDIRNKIYGFYNDPEAIEYQDKQSDLLAKALKEEGRM